MWRNLNIKAVKAVTDKEDIEIEAPINDWVEVTLYDLLNQERKRKVTLYSKLHYITSLDEKVIIKVPKKPVQVGIYLHHC